MIAHCYLVNPRTDLRRNASILQTIEPMDNRIWLAVEPAVGMENRNKGPRFDEPIPFIRTDLGLLLAVSTRWELTG
jgi:hypothetical protein